MIALLAVRSWQSLEEFCLSDGALTDAELSQLVQSHSEPLLHKLDLCENNLHDLDDLEANSWQQMQTFCIDHNNITDLGLCRLIQADWPELKSLSASRLLAC